MFSCGHRLDDQLTTSQPRYNCRFLRVGEPVDPEEVPRIVDLILHTCLCGFHILFVGLGGRRFQFRAGCPETQNQRGEHNREQ